RDLFEPLGYLVSVSRLPLDPQFPEWGPSRYYSVTLSGNQRLQDLLSHINVLIPVLDDEKHYWVGDDEVDKLLRRGGDWLPGHPAKKQIADRELKQRPSLAQEAIERLPTDADVESDDDATPARIAPGREEALEVKISLNSQRISHIADVLHQIGAKSVI